METNRAIVWMFGLAAAAAHAVKGALTHISMNHWSNFSQVKQFFTWNMRAYGWPGFERTTSCLARTSGAELGLFRRCQLTSMILGKISEEFALFMYGVDNVVIWSWPRCFCLLASPLAYLPCHFTYATLVIGRVIFHFWSNTYERSFSTGC